MNGNWKTSILAGMCLVVLAAPPLGAVWMPDGLPVCTAGGTQQYVEMIPDGDGGAIVVWSDHRGGVDDDIYAQRIDATGEVLWTADGVALCTATGAQYSQRVVSDGAGGAIVVWRDNRNGFSPEIYAQRVNAAGNVLWGADGVAVCAVADMFNRPWIAPDGAGGAIVAWECLRDVDYDIYAQRVSASGVMQWTTGGVIVCDAKYDQMNARIVSDGAGGAVVAWIDDRNGNDDLYAQRIDASGAAQWAAGGAPLCVAAADQGSVDMIADGSGGAIVAWDDPRTGHDAAYAQRIDDKGDLLWTASGVPLCATRANQQYPRIATDGAGGAIVVWHDSRAGNYDAYVQRVSAAGTVLWAGTGMPVCTLAVGQYYIEIAADGEGGAYVTWNDVRGGDYDVFAQRIAASGAARWTADGVAICEVEGNQTDAALVLDGDGGAMVAWDDLRDGNHDIYARRVSPAGLLPDQPLIAGVLDVPRDQGGKLTIHWDASACDVLPLTEITHYSVWRRLSAPVAAVTAPGDDAAGGIPDVPPGFEGPAVRLGSGGYSWEWLATVPARYVESYAFTAVSLYDSTGADPGWQHFMVTAHTPLQYLFFDSPVDSGYSVDNLSPAAPVGAVAEQSYVPEGLNLAWEENAEPDLHHYAIYRETDPGFEPSPENLVATPGEAAWFDAEWRWDAGYSYRIAAVDVHGNESGFASVSPEGVTGGDTPPAGATFLAQNVPNPFNPRTVIAFDLGEAGRVSLRVYDVAGRLVATLVDGERPAGRHRVEWNGRIAGGATAASGVYFYRLDAGAFGETKKMILLR